LFKYAESTYACFSSTSQNLPQGMQILYVYDQTETAHIRLNVNMSLCKCTLWQQVALYMEKLNYSWLPWTPWTKHFRYYMKRKWKQNAIGSFLKTVRTFRGTFIIISFINSLSTLLILRPNHRKISNFHIFSLVDCTIITECTIFKCKVSFFYINSCI